MSPVTHFLTGWAFANCARLEQRDRTLVTLACVVPDVDGLGIILELLTRNTTHPLLWFSLYHHSLHSLTFALVVAAASIALARQKWKTGLLALASFHLLAWWRGFSPLEMVSENADSALVKALRRRFPRDSRA
jgi:inner membrane protein